MKILRYTLVADGSSDRTLLPILNWLLDSTGVTYQPQFAERLPSASTGLKNRTAEALKCLVPYDNIPIRSWPLFKARDYLAQHFSERLKGKSA